ncbi:AMP phosphorylase [Candidatus Woesearchaeota archaeon]|nr:AMP phosphorylase [Candidatus Woesearchaeota archaeon]
MKLRVKDMDIATGGTLITILHQKDAEKLDLHHEDRIAVRYKNKKVTAVMDIAESKKAVEPGHIGLFEEVLDRLNVKHGNIVKIDLEEKPSSVAYIRKKLDGEKLSKEEIEQIVKDLLNNDLSTIELTYFVSAVYTRGFDKEETINLTKEMVEHGDTLKLDKRVVIDKHSSGGVPGNRTTMLIVPIIAAAGLTIPKTSSRAITSPSGTADTMEVLTNVGLPVHAMKRIVNKTNACMVWGGAMNLAAADDKMIKIRYPLSLDPKGMLLASILAKKIAVNSTHILIDLPIGKSTKFRNPREARRLGNEFKQIGKKLGLKIEVILTDGNQPIGNGIGPALEARDILYVLRNDPRAPKDLKEKALMMAAKMLEMVGRKNCEAKVREILESGKAYRKMKEIIKEQGGNPGIDPDHISIGEYCKIIKAEKAGRITGIDNKIIAKTARVAGAPRDKGSGIYLHKHVNDVVIKGTPILTIYSESEQKLKYASKIMKSLDGINIR